MTLPRPTAQGRPTEPDTLRQRLSPAAMRGVMHDTDDQIWALLSCEQKDAYRLYKRDQRMRRMAARHGRRGRGLQPRHLRGPGQRALLDTVQPPAPARWPGARADLERHRPRPLRRARRGCGNGLPRAGRRRHRRGGPAHGPRLRRCRHPAHLGRWCGQEGGGGGASRHRLDEHHSGLAPARSRVKPLVAGPAASSRLRPAGPRGYEIRRLVTPRAS